MVSTRFNLSDALRRNPQDNRGHLRNKKVKASFIQQLWTAQIIETI
jgi:hypothetical protein